MFELIGLTTAFLIVGFVIVAALLSLAAPVAWIWMLVDAILREDADYPGSYENARLIWVLLIAFLPVTAVVYFFVVYARAKRGARSHGDEPGAASVEATTGESAMQVAPPVPPAPVSA